MKENTKFNLLFIEEIQNYPALYNQTLSDYSNRLIVESAWAAIGKKFKEPVENCKAKWKGIRSSYSRYLGKQIRGGTGADRHYYLADQLHFLKPHVKPKWASQAYTTSINENSNGLDIELPKIEEIASDDTPLITYTATPSSSCGRAGADIKTKRKRNSKRYKDSKRQRLECHRPDNSRETMQLFLQSLLPRISVWSTMLQSQFQIRLLELMHSIEFSEGREVYVPNNVNYDTVEADVFGNMDDSGNSDDSDDSTGEGDE